MHIESPAHKLKSWTPRGGVRPLQGHTVSEEQSQDSDPGLQPFHPPHPLLEAKQPPSIMAQATHRPCTEKQKTCFQGTSYR